MRTLILGVLMCGVAAQAQQSGMSSMATGGPPVQINGVGSSGAVVGHVYLGDLHQPAKMARVSLLRASDPAQTHQGSVTGSAAMAATTAIDGSYEIRGLAPGSYYVDVAMPGYVSPSRLVDNKDLHSADPDAQGRVRDHMQMVVINESDSVRADVTVERGAALSGVVQYDDGTPVTNGIISAVAPQQGGDPLQIVQLNAGQPIALQNLALNARTDDRGVFRLAGLAAGVYALRVVVAMPERPTQMTLPGQPNGGQSRQIMIQRNEMLNIYAPSTFHRTDAKQFSMGMGEERNGVEILVPLNGLHTVSGRMTGTVDQRPSVILRDNTDSSLIRSTQVSPDGSFSLSEVPDGTYTLRSGDSQTAVTVHGGDLRDVVLAGKTP